MAEQEGVKVVGTGKEKDLKFQCAVWMLGV
jgi:hypothetical protein